MGAQPGGVAAFREDYALLRVRAAVQEDRAGVAERAIQAVWFDQVLPAEPLITREGHRLEVVSPGWWNRGPGPDFRGAQIVFNGVLHNGDVEVHGDAGDWYAHGHHQDPRYNNVVLHVVLLATDRRPAVTAEGHTIATLELGPLVGDALERLPEGDTGSDESPGLQGAGHCARLIPVQGDVPLLRALDLAGDWRLLNKARAMRETMDKRGPDQALYEALLYACGYSAFKHHFLALSRHLPYERARQLAQRDPLLLEAAMLHLAGLMPASLPEDTAPPHYARLRRLREEQLEGIRPLPLIWRRTGVRPINYPERRLAGAVRLLARTASRGLWEEAQDIWRDASKPIVLRRRFEALFPGALGFWASHCTWTGKDLTRPAAPLGAGRVRGIIGNVLVPAALADARARRDRDREERIHAFLDALPAEPGNHVTERMLPHLFGDAKPPRLNFRRQQGLLQLHHDWCEPNPSCRNCSMYRHLDQGVAGETV